MRLVNIETLALESFDDPPNYAILSHRWQGAEIKYEEFVDPKQRIGRGYEKIAAFCLFLKQAQSNPTDRQREVLGPKTRTSSVHYAWIDTCCIDKRSSAELSEAINSMWEYYWNAAFCVVYMSDVPSSSADGWKTAFRESKWFHRGWTLQELLAPRVSVFCSAAWDVVGAKHERRMQKEISLASQIPMRYLEDRHAVFRASVARRMSWASRRQTTRIEDVAYSLFGLFQINLPLLYGEGSRAFARMQKEIIEHTEDETILAWRGPRQKNNPWDPPQDTGALAAHPASFIDSGDLYPAPFVPRRLWRITNRGLELESSLLRVQDKIYLLRLNCVEVKGSSTLAEVLLRIEATKGEGGEHPIRGCVIPLRENADGTFVRCHINTWSDNPVATYTPFKTVILSEKTIVIRSGTRGFVDSRWDDEWYRLGQHVALENSDCLWDRSFSGNWFDRLLQQEVIDEA